MQHSWSYKAAGPLKPKERRLAYCPDMEMNDTNLKNLVTITVSEISTSNNVNTVKEVQGNKTALDDKDSNVRKKTVNDNTYNSDPSVLSNKIAKDTQNDAESQKSHSQSHLTDITKSSGMNISAQVNAIPNARGKLNTSILERKLQALKNLRNNDENNSISSNSDASFNQKADSSLEVNSKSFQTSNILEFEQNKTKQTHAGSQSDTKNTKSGSTKANQKSSSIQEKKIQAFKDLQIRKANFSSTSDTSAKDSSSSAEQSKVGPECSKVELKPMLAENNEKVNRNVNPFKNLDGSKSVFVEKLVTPILMVHTKNDHLIFPQCELRDVPFKSNIRVMLKNMRIQKPKRLQTVTWPHILRGQSMFIIGPAENGKTVGYVPAVCNLVLDSLAKFEGVGPICIIVCATALSVSEVEDYCKKFLSAGERIVSFFSGIDPIITATALLNGCHVLICTAPALVALLETDFSVDLRRLAILVLDDCERHHQVYATELTKIIKHVKVSLKNRADKALKVQFIVASRQWCDFMTPLAKTAPDTVIAIGASQECVLYSKTKTSVSFVKSETRKVKTVVEFLEEIDRTKRTVVVCREDEEVVELENTLKSQKHVVFACNSSMTIHDLCRLNENWANYEEPILGPILICCDGNLTHLNITNANYLVHFSMPPLFSMFCKRFSVLNDNYASIFGPEKDDVKIKIILDETNVEQLPKILHFIKRCTKVGLPNLDNVLQEVLETKDLRKAQKLNPLCNNLLMLGECADSWNCSDRHTIFKEFDEPKNWMPKEGLITFKITYYDSAVTYSARVLSNITKSGVVKYPNSYNTLALKMSMYYGREFNRKLHGVPNVGDVCAVALRQNFFERCKVMKVIPSDTKNTNHVLINLLEEEQMTVVSDVLLYYLPDDLKAIETHIVKVRLANIQPKDKDVTFSLAAKEHLQQMTERGRDHGLYMRGQVAMTLGNTIFVNTAEACVNLSSLGETIVKLDFKEELLNRHAEPNPRHIEKLKDIGGMIDSIDITELEAAPKVRKCPKWAHLHKDDYSTVIFTGVDDDNTIFLRHAKFKNLLDSLLKDIKKYVENAPQIDPEEIYVGNYVLAEFPGDATYERARIDKIVNDKIVDCFFVDNGDWKQVSVNKLKTITENLMYRLPFQAIECRLVGVKPPGNADAWPEFSTNWLTDNCFEDKDGKQKQVFVKYFTKEAATVTGGHKYGVVILDTSIEEDVVINKIMIELNLAKVIKDEEKYIHEPFNIKRVTSSSSDNEDNVTEKHNSSIDNRTPVVKDLVPLQVKENETSESTDKPAHVLFGKPIRSVPLVSDDSRFDPDRWDMNVDKNTMGFFRNVCQANVTKQSNTDNVTPLQKTGADDELKINNAKNTSEKIKTTDTSEKEVANDIPLQKIETDDELKINDATNTSEKTKTTHTSEKEVANDLDTTNEETKDDSSVNSSSSAKRIIDKQTQLSSCSLDSDDIDISDDRIRALRVFKRKMSKEDVKEKDNTSTEKDLTEKQNDTLDSDDLVSVANETPVPTIATETIDKPRKPKLVWRQTKTTVTIKINLIGVEHYSLEMKDKSMKFQTWHNDTNYEFEFELLGVIVPKKSVHSNKGQYIQVNLVKMLARTWISLTKDFSNKTWVMYDVDALDVASDEEKINDEARKVIKQNHENAGSSSDDDFVDDTRFRYKRD